MPASTTGKRERHAAQRLSAISAGSFRRAFTVVELLVVITVIVLVLALAVPGLSAMNQQARMSSAIQKINGMLTRAYYRSVARSTLTAVRFMPAEWEVQEDGETVEGGRQRIAVYQYVAKTDRPTSSGGFVVGFEEYFQRIEDIPSVELPPDIWIAPLEALSDQPGTIRYLETDPDPYNTNIGTQFVLNGSIKDTAPGRVGDHLFELDAERSLANDSFLNADDFLIVFDPHTGLVTGHPQGYQLRAYDPIALKEHAGVRDDGTGAFLQGQMFQRIGFSGIVVYRREPFVALGSEATGQERQQYLRSEGQPYMVHRFSGGLLSGMQGQE